MISEFSVRDIGLIEGIETDFSSGLNVITGETGSGKSSLVNSLMLLVGQRADSTSLKDGVESALIQACVNVLDNDGEPEELIVKRKLTSSGRSSSYINGELMSLKEMSDRLEPWIDFHGQHDNQSLFSAQAHLDFIDQWDALTIAPRKLDYCEAFRRYHAAKIELEELTQGVGETIAKLENAHFIAEQLEKANLRQGEYEELESEVRLNKNAEQLKRLANSVLGISKSEGGVLDNLHQINAELDSMSLHHELMGVLSKRAKDVTAEFDDIVSELAIFASRLDFDEDCFDATMNRLGVLDSIKKRFGPSMDDVFERLEKARALIDSSQNYDEHLDQCKTKLKNAESHLRLTADMLSEARRSAAESFTTELTLEAEDLSLAGAIFSYEFKDLDIERFSENSPATFELLFAPAQNVALKPLRKIASGGELSRIALAIKGLIVRSAKSRAEESCDVPSVKKTLVFDEIDSGIGGHAAHSIAKRLLHLAKENQLIVITHLAQIAAVADRHFLIQKESPENSPRTTLRVLLGEQERANELARLLSGSNEEEALAHAKALLKESR